MISHLSEWNQYKRAFEQLGLETRGMSAIAAAALAEAAAAYYQDHKKGYQLLNAGPPAYACFDGKPLSIIRIPDDYPGCQDFWDIDLNNLRAKITTPGVEYVKKHADVFQLLLGSSHRI